MAGIRPFPFILGFIVLYCFAGSALAFGAGNIAGISKVEGQNCKLNSYPGRPDLVELLTQHLSFSSFQGAMAISKMPSSRS